MKDEKSTRSRPAGGERGRKEGRAKEGKGRKAANDKTGLDRG